MNVLPQYKNKSCKVLIQEKTEFATAQQQFQLRL